MIELKVDISKPCIKSHYPLDRDGYGILGIQFGRRRTTTRHHRVVYCESRQCRLSSIQGKLVRHMCNNPWCVEPQHLALGSGLDNAQDRVLFGNNLLGEKHNLVKLTEAEVLEIRASKEALKVLAARYSVSQSLISLVRNRKIWKHLK